MHLLYLVENFGSLQWKSLLTPSSSDRNHKTGYHQHFTSYLHGPVMGFVLPHYLEGVGPVAWFHRRPDQTYQLSSDVLEQMLLHLCPWSGSVCGTRVRRTTPM